MHNSVCVFDFNGYSEPGHYPIAQWADYIPGVRAGDEATDSRVVFGGDWSDVPDWIVDHEPTEEEVLAHVKRAII